MTELLAVASASGWVTTGLGTLIPLLVGAIGRDWLARRFDRPHDSSVKWSAACEAQRRLLLAIDQATWSIRRSGAEFDTRIWKRELHDVADRLISEVEEAGPPLLAVRQGARGSRQARLAGLQLGRTGWRWSWRPRVVRFHLWRARRELLQMSYLSPIPKPTIAAANPKPTTRPRGRRAVSGRAGIAETLP